jgi:hypothetical protein
MNAAWQAATASAHSGLRRRVGVELMHRASKQLEKIDNLFPSCADTSLVVGPSNSVISVSGRIRHGRNRIGRPNSDGL